MSWFLEYWKPLDSLATSFASDAPASKKNAEPPTLARYRDVPVWIHPRLPGEARFVTDSGDAGFDPENALENVMLERYVPGGGIISGKTKVLKKAYYLLKPLMSRSVQLAIQRKNALHRLKSVSFPDWPQDDTVDRLQRALMAHLMEKNGLLRTPIISFWPRGFRWAACFTHDVETSAGLTASATMASIEEKRGVRSTWFIVPERYPVRPADFAYLVSAGHEIGVHGLHHSGQLFSSRKEFLRRAPLINRYVSEWGCVGFRSPALYRVPDWIPELDIRYDSSYMDTAVLEPQLGGVCTVFPYFLDRGVVELPITMPMDHHLINLLRRDVVAGMLAKFQWAVERQGLANFLFHPDYNLSARQMEDYGEVVARVCECDGGWITTAANIADWWRRRGQSRLIEDENGLRIEGPAAVDGVAWFLDRVGANVVVSPH